MSGVRRAALPDSMLAFEASYPSYETEVRVLLVHGQRFSLLIDTLARPQDLGAVRDAVARRGNPLLVVNSHADWDHWWGNEAFPDAPVIASRAAVRRQRREGARELRRFAVKDPELFGDVRLRTATVAVDGVAEIDLGGIMAEMHPFPGHTHDQIVVWFPKERVLFAADAAEDPIPVVTEGPVAPWIESLEVWSSRARTVVPSHGAISGPELLARNAAYLRGLSEAPAREVPELEGANAFYRQAHRRNLKRATAPPHPV